MPQPHWSEIVIKMANDDLSRAKSAMVDQLYRPVLRQPPVRQQLGEALAAPEALPIDARQRLLAMLKSKYGEQAQNIAPYLIPQEESPNGF